MAWRVICACDARKNAERDREFVYIPFKHAWVFANGPRRSMSDRARYFAFSERSEFKHVDNNGAHYFYVTCCWCGHDLPGTPPTVLAQADGDEGRES